jgi:hypothetical protein
MDDMSNSEHDIDEVSAPQQSLLQKWLREVHGIDVWVEPVWSDEAHVGVEYTSFYEGKQPWDQEDVIMLEDYKPTYEEALEVGLKEALSQL